MRWSGKLAIVQAAGNALLLLLGYYWLGTGESRAVSLVWSLLVACLWIALACWLHGASLAWFAGKDALSPAFRTALRNLPILFAFAAGTLFVYYLVGQLADYAPAPAARVSSWLTLHLHKPVKPAAVLKAAGVLFWLVRWVIVPVLLVPLFGGLSIHGVRGIGHLRRRWIYWLEAPVLLLVALWLPLKILAWVPRAGGFGMEMASFLLRLIVAYFLFVAASLALEWITAHAQRARIPSPGATPS